MMQRQLEHMVRLVDDLLDLSRIHQGKIELRTERIPLRDAVDSALETCGADDPPAEPQPDGLPAR